MSKLLKKLKQQIADLEAKLEESENRNEQLVDALNGEVFINYKLPMENAQLKKQLAEKENQLQKYERLNGWTINGYTLKCFDEEIGKLKQQLAEKTLTIEQINKAFIENRNLWKGKYERVNQDKISFAVEKLEKVKELAHNRIRQIADDLSEEDDERLNQKHTIHGLATIITDIDNQIKELKKEIE